MSHYFLFFLGSGQKASGTKKNVMTSLRDALQQKGAGVNDYADGLIISGPKLHLIKREKALPELITRGKLVKKNLGDILPKNRRTDIVCIGHSRGAVLAGIIAKYLAAGCFGKEYQALEGKVGKTSVLAIDPVPELGLPAGAFERWDMGLHLMRYWYVYMSAASDLLGFERLHLATREGDQNVEFRRLLVPGNHNAATKDPSENPSAKILLRIAHEFVNKSGFEIGVGPTDMDVCTAYFEAAVKKSNKLKSDIHGLASLHADLVIRTANYDDIDRVEDLHMLRTRLFINSHLSSLIHGNIKADMKGLYNELKEGKKIEKSDARRKWLTGLYGEKAFKYIKICAKRGT